MIKKFNPDDPAPGHDPGKPDVDDDLPRDEPLGEAAEEESVEEAAKLSARLIYEVIRRDGIDELRRPVRSLIWSGLAAGVMISFSVLGEAIFRTYLPKDADWTYLVENLGYSIGFVLVIMGRMQLFTENTISTVLPAMADPRPTVFKRIGRLWVVVLSANLVGAFLAALYIAYGAGVPDALLPAVRELSEHATGMGAWQSFLRAVPAGLLIAARVWSLPQAESQQFILIMMMTWLIAAGDFTHVVAGSVEMAFLMVNGELGLLPAVFGFFLPVLAGNVVGGTAIFALLAWGQVKGELIRELEHKKPKRVGTSFFEPR